MPQPPITPPRRITPGLLSAADAAEINRWAELLYRLALEREPELSAGTEPLRDLDSPTGFWARIEGDALTDGRHSWREVDPTFPGDGGGNVPVVWVNGYRSSSFGGTPAYEANGGVAPPGSIVWMQFSPDRRRFVFERPDPGLPTESPADPLPGSFWFSVATNTFWVFNGSIWISLCPCTDPDEPLPASCCPEGQELPSQVPVVVTAASGTCDPWVESSFNLTWSEVNGRWEGQIGADPDTTAIYLRCVEDGEGQHWTLELVGHCSSDGEVAADTDPEPTCDPVCIRFSGVTITGCCEGQISLQVGDCPVAAPCCPVGAPPPTLELFIENPTGDCGLMVPAEPVQLVQEGSTGEWLGTLAPNTEIKLLCSLEEPPQLHMQLTGDCQTSGSVAVNDADPDFSCDPPCLKWPGVQVSGCCTGTVDLRIGCAAGDVQTSCCANALPATLRATFLDMGGCACVDGQQVDLVYNAGTSKWEGTLTGHGCDDMTLAFYCDSDTSQFLLDVSGCGVSPGATATTTVCDPLDVDFEFAELGTCCGAGGGGNFTVSIGPVPAP